jgi:hypothetical protein
MYVPTEYKYALYIGSGLFVAKSQSSKIEGTRIEYKPSTRNSQDLACHNNQSLNIAAFLRCPPIYSSGRTEQVSTTTVRFAKHRSTTKNLEVDASASTSNGVIDIIPCSAKIGALAVRRARSVTSRRGNGTERLPRSWRR